MGGVTLILFIAEIGNTERTKSDDWLYSRWTAVDLDIYDILYDVPNNPPMTQISVNVFW